MNKQYPFKFLNSYERDDKDFFFGRDEEIETLYNMTFQTKIMLVYGTSGTGKTSLIQCGLAKNFQTYDWAPLFIRRENNIINTLDKCLCIESDEAFTYSKGDGKTINDLTAKLEAVYKATFKPIYLIFDQFEELYVLGDGEEQNNFISVIQQILSNNQPVKIIISIREEYLGYLYNFEKEVPELLRKKLRVEPMNREKVRFVIEGFGKMPNSLVKLQSGEERKIADAIFEKLREGKTLTIQLPYLQVLLDKFYLEETKDEKRETDVVFTLATCDKVGTIGDILRNFLDEQVLKTSSMLGQKPEVLWDILSPFVTLDGTKYPLKIGALFDRFPNIDRQTIKEVIEAFKNSRILRYSEEAALFEITHDSLAKQVNAKRSNEEIAILEVQRLIKSQVAVKEEAREFFTEKQLLFIEPYLEKFEESPEESEWIKKSRENVEERKRKEEERKEEEIKKEQKRKQEEFEREQKRKQEEFEREQIRKQEEFEREQKRKEAEYAAEQERKAEELAKTRKWMMIFGSLFVIAFIASLLAGFQWKNANLAKEKASEAQIEAQQNLIKAFQADSIRYRGEISRFQQNIDSYGLYDADDDVKKIEQRKIDSLERLILSLNEKIKALK